MKESVSLSSSILMVGLRLPFEMDMKKRLTPLALYVGVHI